MRKGVKKLILTLLIFAVSVSALAVLREYLSSRETLAEQAARGKSNYVPIAENVPENDKLRKIFTERHPDYEIILACSEDITDDGEERPGRRLPEGDRT